MISNIIIFIVQLVYLPFTRLFALVPALALKGAFWQFITYMFLHGDLLHLLINMMGLLIFGAVVERTLGEERFIMLYFLSGIGSALFHIMLTGVSDVSLLGASGAVFGVLTAFAFLYPDIKLIVIPIPYPISAKYVVLGFVLFSLFMGFTNVFGDNIAYFGHVGGVITGLIVMLYWKKRDKKSSDEFDFPSTYEYFWE